MHALGRLGEPEAVASFIAGLLEPTNDWVLDKSSVSTAD